MKKMKNLVAGLVLATMTATGVSYGKEADVTAELSKSPAVNMARQFNDAFIEVAEKISPAVVVIRVEQKPTAAQAGGGGSLLDRMPPEWRKFFGDDSDNGDDGGNGAPNGNGRGRRNNRGGATPRQAPRAFGSGSGVVLTEDGYILTNFHVVENGEKITVRFKDSREFPAEVKGFDKQSDLAVIKIKAKGLVTAKLGDSANTRVGEFVIAIGAPFDLDYTVTVGHVSAKGRSFEGQFMLEGMGTYFDQDFIQTDASINPGNSGGPLVNLYGEVIGINAMIRGMNRGIGFAIPSSLAKVVSEHLIKDGRYVRSFLGVSIGELRSDKEFRAFVPSTVEDGVVIHAIDPKGPAAKSELKASDVVVAVNGKAVKTSRQLKEAISMTPVGQYVNLDLYRGEKKMAVKVKTEALPESAEEEAPVKTSRQEVEPTRFGINVAPLTRELADRFGIEAKSGVVVTKVEEGSAAEDKIRKGDVITEVNRKPVSTPKQFNDALKATDPKKGAVVNLISNGTSRFVVLNDE